MQQKSLSTATILTAMQTVGSLQYLQDTTLAMRQTTVVFLHKWVKHVEMALPMSESVHSLYTIRTLQLLCKTAVFCALNSDPTIQHLHMLYYESVSATQHLCHKTNQYILFTHTLKTSFSNYNTSYKDIYWSLTFTLLKFGQLSHDQYH